MESEKNLSAPDFASPANFANATATMNASVQGGPRWLRRVTLAFTLIIAAASLLGLIGKISEIGSLPRCDAQRTKDTLSDTTVNAGKDEVLCKASLALRDGGALEYDFRIFRDESGTKVQITDSRRL